MFYYPSELTRLGDDYRLRVEQDPDASCPRGDWDMLTGFVKLEGHGDSRRADVPAIHEPPLPLADAAHRMQIITGRPQRTEGWEALRRGGPRLSPSGVPWNWQSIPTGMWWRTDHDLVQRWARIFYGLHVEYDADHGGYWFVDPDELRENWPDLALGSPESLARQAVIIDSEQEDYRKWAEGEVYAVVLERRVEWQRVGMDDDSADRMETWEEVDSIWGSYLDKDYTELDVAAENFSEAEDLIIQLRDQRRAERAEREKNHA